MSPFKAVAVTLLLLGVSLTPMIINLENETDPEINLISYEDEDDTAVQHVHDLSDLYAGKPASCSTAGNVDYRVCSCGAYFDVHGNRIKSPIIPATGHVWQQMSATDPTCTTAGKAECLLCSVCGIQTPAESIPATGHSFTVTTKCILPTCLTSGATAQEKCDLCGYIKNSKIIPALGHDFIDGICSRCGSVQLDHEHVVGFESGDATCSAEGYEKTYCTICNETLKFTLKDKVAHTFKVLTEPPSCTESGHTLKSCENCGYSLSEDIPAIGHTVVIDEAVPATFSSNGLSQGAHCSECGECIKEQTVIEPEVEVVTEKYVYIDNSDTATSIAFDTIYTNLIQSGYDVFTAQIGVDDEICYGFAFLTGEMIGSDNNTDVWLSVGFVGLGCEDIFAGQEVVPVSTENVFDGVSYYIDSYLEMEPFHFIINDEYVFCNVQQGCIEIDETPLGVEYGEVSDTLYKAAVKKTYRENLSTGLYNYDIEEYLVSPDTAYVGLHADPAYSDVNEDNVKSEMLTLYSEQNRNFSNEEWNTTYIAAIGALQDYIQSNYEGTFCGYSLTSLEEEIAKYEGLALKFEGDGFSLYEAIPAPHQSSEFEKFLTGAISVMVIIATTAVLISLSTVTFGAGVVVAGLVAGAALGGAAEVFTEVCVNGVDPTEISWQKVGLAMAVGAVCGPFLKGASSIIVGAIGAGIIGGGNVLLDGGEMIEAVAAAGIAVAITAALAGGIFVGASVVSKVVTKLSPTVKKILPEGAKLAPGNGIEKAAEAPIKIADDVKFKMAIERVLKDSQKKTGFETFKLSEKMSDEQRVLASKYLKNMDNTLPSDFTYDGDLRYFEVNGVKYWDMSDYAVVLNNVDGKSTKLTGEIACPGAGTRADPQARLGKTKIPSLEKDQFAIVLTPGKELETLLLENSSNNVAVMASSASNYDQAIADIALKLGWQQKDLSLLLKICGKGDCDISLKLAKSLGISKDQLIKTESGGYKISNQRLIDKLETKYNVDLEGIKDIRITIHETIVLSDEGQLMCVGQIVPFDLHNNTGLLSYHEGMNAFIKTNSLDAPSFVETDAGKTIYHYDYTGVKDKTRDGIGYETWEFEENTVTNRIYQIDGTVITKIGSY